MARFRLKSILSLTNMISPAVIAKKLMIMANAAPIAWKYGTNNTLATNETNIAKKTGINTLFITPLAVRNVPNIL